MKAKYFQTWAWNSKLRRKCRWCAFVWQWLCGIRRHEPSKTEWGYGGGETADVWCRWCNKHMLIPKSELLFLMEKDKRSLLNKVASKI